MNMRNILPLLAIAILGICSTGFAQTYGLGYDQTRYDTTEGETVDVRVVLTETTTGGETARLEAGGSNDLFFHSMSVDYSAFAGAANGSTFSSISFNPGFLQPGAATEVRVEDTGSVVSFETFEPNGIGLTGTMVAPNVYEIEIATLTFLAGDFNSTTTLDLGASQFSSGATNPTILFADNQAPAVTFSDAEIFVNAVPEPGSFALLALAGIGILTRRRK